MKGVNDAIKTLQLAGDKLQRKGIVAGLKAGCKVVQAQAQADAPHKTGATAAAIKIKAGKRKKGRVSYLVTIGQGWFKGDEYYASFVALGHKQGKRKLGDKRKDIPGNPYLKNAMNQATEAALEAIHNTINQYLREIMDK